jgi:hypothetical protein
VERSLQFSQDTSDTQSLGSPVKTDYIEPSGVEVPDMGTRGHAKSKHVDTYDTIGWLLLPT